MTATGSIDGSAAPRFDVLGVGVSAVDMDAAVRAVLECSRSGRGGYVCVTGVHGVMEAQRDPGLARIHNESLLTVPDGMPLVWVARRRAIPGVGRVYGPDLMRRVMHDGGAGDGSGEKATGSGGAWGGHAGAPGHFLMGSTPEVLKRLTDRLPAEYSGLRIAGSRSLPFRELTDDDWRGALDQVEASGASIVWVGLSTPKQERFMAEFCRRRILACPAGRAAVLVGVGAAFDLLAGLRRDAPGWMKRAGLQWLHRMIQEPRRLGPRYLRIVPGFLLRLLARSLGGSARPAKS